MGFLPLFHKGVCNTMVMDWFRRIHAGSRTWLHEGGEVQPKAPWVKSVKERLPFTAGNPSIERWMTLQATSKFEHDKFFHTSRPFDVIGPANTKPENSVIGSHKTVNRTLNQNDGLIITESLRNFRPPVAAAAAPAMTEQNAFFILSFFSAEQGGHSIGIHLSYNADDSVHGHKFKHGGVQFFDPNVGEYYLPWGEFPMFLFELGQEKVYKNNVDCFSVSRIPVWWGRGSAENPFIHSDDFRRDSVGDDCASWD